MAKRSIHIEAPVEKVFDHIKDPHNQFDSYYTNDKPGVAEVDMAPDSGEGSTWKWMSGVLLFIHLHGTMTREAFVPNERIVDRSSTGIVWTYTVKPDQTGTILSLEAEFSTPAPFLDRIGDKVFWNADRDLDTMLGNLKRAIET